MSWEPSPGHRLLSGCSPGESGPLKGGWGEDVNRVSSSQAPTQRENTQREGWAFQQRPEGKSEVGLGLPRGPGRSRLEPLGPWGRPPPCGTTGWREQPEKPQSWATQGIKGPHWGDLRAAPLRGGGWQFQ